MSVRATSNIIGVGSFERHWVDVKHIKYGKCLHIFTKKREKQSMVYTKVRLNKEEFHRDELTKLNDVFTAWGDKDKRFNLWIERFCIDVDALKIPSIPKQYFIF